MTYAFRYTVPLSSASLRRDMPNAWYPMSVIGGAVLGSFCVAPEGFTWERASQWLVLGLQIDPDTTTSPQPLTGAVGLRP